MNKTSLQKLLVITAVVMTFSSGGQARADEDSPLKAPPKPDYRTADKLGNQLEDVSMSNDIEAADSVAYKGVENDAKNEAAALRKDIARLEKQIAALKEGAGQAKKSAELAQKKTDLVRSENVAARKRVAAANKVKEAAEKERQIEEQKLGVVQNEAAAIAEENRKVEEFIKLAREDRAKIMERANAVRAQIAQAKVQQQALIEKNKLMKAQNKVMDQKVTKAEERLSNQPSRAAASTGN